MQVFVGDQSVAARGQSQRPQTSTTPIDHPDRESLKQFLVFDDPALIDQPEAGQLPRSPTARVPSEHPRYVNHVADWVGRGAALPSPQPATVVPRK